MSPKNYCSAYLCVFINTNYTIYHSFTGYYKLTNRKFAIKQHKIGWSKS